MAAGGRELWFEYQLRAAREQVRLGHNTAAIERLEKCRGVHPDRAEVLLLGARVARRTGHLESAEALLDRCWQLHGDGGELVFERVLLRATRGEVEATLPLLQERITAGGSDARLAREALLIGLLHRFRWGEAGSQLHDWLQQLPDDTIALLLSGKLQEQRGDMSGAIAAYRRVVELDPEHDEARLRLAGMLLLIRDGQEAETHLRSLRSRLPASPDVRVQFSRALALQGKTEESLAELDGTLRDYPTHASALGERGRLAASLDDPVTAERCLAQAVQLDPGDFATRHQYALVLTRNGKAAAAAAELASVKQLQADSERIKTLIEGPLQKSPNDPAVLHEIAMITLRAGHLDEALRWFKATLEVSPDHLPTHRTLAVYYEESGRPALAAKHRAIAQRLGGARPK